MRLYQLRREVEAWALVENSFSTPGLNIPVCLKQWLFFSDALARAPGISQELRRMGFFHFSKSIWRKTDFTRESQNCHHIGKQSCSRKEHSTQATISRSIPPSRDMRERIMEKREDRERGLLHCYMEYVFTCQHFLLILSASNALMWTSKLDIIQAVPGLDKPISWQKGGGGKSQSIMARI